MRKNIHPESYKNLQVRLTDGSVVKMRSTYPGDEITLEIDPLSHPAWKEGGLQDQSGLRGSQGKSFQKRFGLTSFSDLA